MSLCSISVAEGWFKNLTIKMHTDISHEIKFAVINMDGGEEECI
jgi:hypothetical protein